MPFVSKAQVRKFHLLKSQGKMSQATIDKWHDETDNEEDLPEKKAFLIGFLKEAFFKRIEKVVLHNQANDNKKNVKLTYKKLNGRTVKRKITPISLRGNLVIAHDHKRDALRSFKIERIKHMEKAASFWIGFEKQASAWGHIAEVAGLATLAAPTIAEMTGHKVPEKHKHIAELAGLGVLAAPSLHALFQSHFAPALKVLA